jgi:hypothetical protein
MNTEHDFWMVQTSRDSRYWRDETTGPEVIYNDKDDALSYAVQLAVIHPHVQLVHSVRTTEVIK